MRGSVEDASRAAGAGRGRLVPAALLLALLLVALHGALAGRLFYLRDISQNHYPVREMVTGRLRALELPLWDPYHGGGTPLLANPNNLVLHPISLIFLVLPLDAAFSAAIVLQFALLAAGGYLLARASGAGREGAALTAAILSLSGPAASLASLLNVLSAFAWVPLGLWALLRGIEPGRGRLLPIAALCLSIVVMAGEPASLFAFLLLAPALMFTKGGTDPAAAPRRVVAAFIGAAAAALLLASAQILPARALLAESVRGEGFAAGEGMKWSLLPARMVELALPGIFGDPTRLSPQAWWGRGLFEGGVPFLLVIYIGAAPIILALLGAAARGPGSTRRRMLLAAAGAALLLAMGSHTPLYRVLFAALPAVRQVRYPERFLLAALVPVALLAGCGLDRLLRPRDGTERRRAIAAAVAAAGLAFLCVSLVAASPASADRFLAGPAGVPEALLRSPEGAVLRGAVLRSALWLLGETALVAAAALAAGRSGAGGRAGLLGYGLVLATGASLITASAPALSTAAPGWLKAVSPLSAVLGHGPGAPRLHHAARPETLSVWAKTDELAWGFRFDRFTYALATGRPDRIPTILDPATDRLDLRAQAGLGREIGQLPVSGRVRLLSICGAGFLISWERLDDPGLEPVPALEEFSRPPTRLYRIRETVPRVRIVGRARRPSFPADLARSLVDPGFDPNGEVILDGAPDPPGPGLSGIAGRAVLLEDAPERLRIGADAERAGFLVISDAFSSGWDAEVDGARRPVLRANGLFRAVPIDAGRHTVTLAYRPAPVRWGLAAGGVGILALAAWWISAGRIGR